MSADLIPLLPFQKLIDVPEKLQRFSVPLRGLAITEIVFCILLVPSGVNFCNGIVIFLTLIAAGTVLHNTNRWSNHDICFNLVRPYPTALSKSCGPPHKCCCSRLSTFHFGTTAFVLVANCFNILWALHSCVMVWLAVLGFVVLFGCLTASSVMIRKIEHDMAPVQLLPPNKMVCLTAESATSSTTHVTGIPVTAVPMTNVAIKFEQCQ